MKNKILYTLIILSSQLYAQTYLDAQQFSDVQIAGTARTASMAGAFGALGADISSLSTNPAGIGLYQSMDFSFTLDLGVKENTSYYNGFKTFNNTGDFNLNSIGIVFPVKTSKNDDWKRSNFGLAYNNSKHFKSNTLIYGYDEGSIVDVFYDQAIGKPLNELNSFFELSAFDTYLIDLDVDTSGNFIDNGEYFRIVDSGQNQYKQIVTDGQLGEMVLSYGASYKEKLYLGSSLSITTLEYIKSSRYAEYNFDDTLSTVQTLDFYEYQYTSGAGLGLKLGAIYKANDNLRLGLAYHTPTIISLSDEYENVLDVNHSFNDSAYTYSKSSPYGIYDYRVTTPSKILLSGAIVLNKNFIISTDFELVDYSQMRIDGQKNDNDYFDDQNRIIQNRYSEVSNIKLGAELNLSSILLRGGYATFGNPLSGDITSDNPLADVYSNEKEMYTFGIGRRNKFNYIDLAFVFSEVSRTTWLYNANYNSPTKVVDTNFGLILTMGWKL